MSVRERDGLALEPVRAFNTSLALQLLAFRETRRGIIANVHTDTLEVNDPKIDFSCYFVKMRACRADMLQHC